ncbi:MAG: flagellar hook protein FlgE [Acidimicrobiia bacterium]
MLRSMFSGVSGLRSHQTMMDVIGNNISNANTIGFKGSTVLFQDLLSQALRGAGVPTATAGGTNPAQVGLGVRLAGISTSFNQGASQVTGRATDLSIQGDGFFVVRSQGQSLYTRAGSFDFDALGRLVTVDGAVLQGWSADALGTIDANRAPGDLTMPLGQTIAPNETQLVRLAGNLDASAPLGTLLSVSETVFDRQGREVTLALTYEKTGADEWTVTAEAGSGGTLVAVPVTDGVLTFSPTTGERIPTPPATTLGPVTVDLATVGTFGGPVELDGGAPGAPEGVRQFAGAGSVAVLTQDGSGIGTLQAFTIGADGVVTGVFSNGRSRPIGQLALASFANPAGLEKVGGSLYRPTVNSGLAQVGAAGTGGRGVLAGSTLEMSNVDLAQEFTNLILSQRGFQANARVITASDELLQDLVNLKR